MIRFILVASVLVLYLIISIPIMLILLLVRSDCADNGKIYI